MNKNILTFLLVVGVAVFALVLLRGQEDTWLCDSTTGTWVAHGAPNTPTPEESCGVTNYKNATYFIDGASIQLVDGYAEEVTIPGSASKIITRYFGNEIYTDLDGDGRDDVAFILTQERGGSGTFFYAVAARNTEQGYIGSDGYFLGDRIAPQSTTLSPNPRHKNVVVFNYADRALDEPMTVRPSIGKSTYLKLDATTMQWGVVEPDFEGESDAHYDIIRVDQPVLGATITSPLTISGEARGMWFFEALAPVVLTDWDGRIIAEGYIQAQGEWMTTEFVPFIGTLEFTSPYTTGAADFMRNGTLVIRKDNPSGLPAYDDAIEIPVQF